MDIEALNNEWFYDDITPRGVSFDGFLPQACKTPLGDMVAFELIHSPAKMAEFQNNLWHKKNPGLGEILLTVAPLENDRHHLLDEYRIEVEKFLSIPCDFDECNHDVSSGRHPSRGACRGLRTLKKDISRYGENMSGSNESNDGKLYDVKKEIYRLTDRVLAGLAKCFHIEANGAFEVLAELRGKGIIQPTACDNAASAVGIALKLRLSTYLQAGKQQEEIKRKSDERTPSLCESTLVYRMPDEKELFHFFYVTIPLYEELHRFCDEDESCADFRSQDAFFDCSDAIKGQAYCRVLNYAAALHCYDRALAADPGNTELVIRRIRVAFLTNDSQQLGLSTKRKLDGLLRTVDAKYSLPEAMVEQDNHDIANSDYSCDSTEDVQVPSIKSHQIVNILYLSSAIFSLEGDFETARAILGQCLEIVDSPGLQLLMKLEILKLLSISGAPITEEELQAIIAQLCKFVNNEGVSVQAIIWLNQLSEVLSRQGKYDEAYRCLQRALAMGRTIFGQNINLNIAHTLLLLGNVCMVLLKYDESKYHLEQLENFLQALTGVVPLIMIKETYRLLSAILAYTNHPAEAIAYLQKALTTTTCYTAGDFMLDCMIHCTMAICLYNQDATDKAWQSALDAEGCLKQINDAHTKTILSCTVAKTYFKVGRSEEALNLIKQQLQCLDSHSDAVIKIRYLSNLGKLCQQQGLVTDSEYYYKKALEIQRKSKDNMLDIVENLLAISNILLESGRSSEAVSYIDEAWKYTSTETNRDKKCEFLSSIAECWEKVERFYLARKCLQEALEICRESVVTSKVSLIPFHVHIKLGDLAGNVSSNAVVGDSVSAEQVKSAKLAHYDRAAEILRSHLTSGNQFDSTTIVWFRCLALKYSSIDFSKEENLLLEALKISEEIYGSHGVSEVSAGILIDLSDVYYEKEDYGKATDFLDRSVKMEMEMHLSDPYHPHISRLISCLSTLYVSLPGSKQLEDVLKRVVDFIELGNEKESPNSVAKANYFVSIAYLFVCLGNLNTAESYNEMANEIFTAISRNPVPKGVFFNTKMYETTKRILGILKRPGSALSLQLMRSSGLIASFFHVKNTEVLSSVLTEETGIAKQLLNREGTDLCTPNEADTGEKSSGELSNNVDTLPSSQAVSRDCEKSTHINDDCNASTEADPGLPEMSHERKVSCEREILSLSSSIRSENAEEITCREKDVTAISSSMSKTSMQATESSVPQRKTNGKDNQKETSSERKREGNERSDKAERTVFEGDAKESLESMMESLNLITDSVTYNLSQGDVEKAAESTRDCLNPPLMSVIAQATPDPVQFFLSEALQARDNNNVTSMESNIHLAFKYPSNPQTKVKLLKLFGEYHTYMQNYRKASISFTKAVGVYKSSSVGSDLPGYTESFIGLTRSHLLCNEGQAAWIACQQGMQLIANVETGALTSRPHVELLYLAAKCTIKLSVHSPASEKDLERAVSFCLKAISASEVVDQVMGCSDLTEELGGWERGEFFSLKCEIKLLLATTLLTLQQPEEARDIVMEMSEFLGNIALVFETFPKTSWPGGEVTFFKIQRRLYSWIGQALMLSGDTEAAVNPLMKSLAAFLIPIPTTIMPPQEEIVALLDAITAINPSTPQVEFSQFRHTLELCKRQFVEQDVDLKELQYFLGGLGNMYVDCGRTQEAVVVYETGLAFAECIDSLQESRKQMLLYLTGAHTLQAIKDAGKGTDEERRLAEGYYQSAVTAEDQVSHIMHANTLLREGRFKDAVRVLDQATGIGEELWHKFIIISYSKRLLYGAVVQQYIDSNGQLLTSRGNLVYSMLVQAYVAMGMKKAAVNAYEILSTSGGNVKTGFEERAPWLPSLLGSCQKCLVSLIEDKRDLHIDDSDLPLAEEQLGNVYHKLGEYELALHYCNKARMSTKSPPAIPRNESELFDRIQRELLTLHLAGNALVMLGRGNESYSYFIQFLQVLHIQTKILDQAFDKANSILAEYSFADVYYLYRALGIVLLGRAKIDGAVECYEYCLRLDQDCKNGQDLVATLAELYQSRAFTDGKDNKSTYQKWMKKALDCYERLLGKGMELNPFVEGTFGSLLSRMERFQEAASRFEHVLSTSDDTLISFSDVDKPLLMEQLRREIEARGSMVLPLKVYVYSQAALTYLRSGEIEKAQESARRMEEYTSGFGPNTPNISLILSVLGYTHNELGNKSKAAKLFNDVLKMEPGHGPVTIALESCTTCKEEKQ